MTPTSAYIVILNDRGHWYRLSGSPWNDQYYAAANTFMNGDPWNGPYTHNTDFSVPNCGTATPSPKPTVSLAQGSSAPVGYRYAITLSSFSPNAEVSISCRDSTDSNGFYSFTLRTDSSGHVSTQSYCYSNDGPDHWVIANGVTSNHVSWGSRSSGGGGTPATPPSTPGSTGTGTSSSPPTTVNANYNRTTAVTWALAHAQDPQGSGTLCTWFVSQALWAGGMQQTSAWRKGTYAATYVRGLINYLRANNSVYWKNITSNLTSNAVPQAERGDIIVYNWNDGGEPFDHLSLVVDIASGQYPQISEWGQFDFTHHPWYKITRPGSPYVKRGWTWSVMHNEWLQREHPGMQAYLLHINGGYITPTF